MKNLFEAGRVEEFKRRIAQVRPDSPRQWGTMSPGQMLEHCSRGMETGLGITNPPRMFIGRVIGRMIKSRIMANDEPLRRNTPTAKLLVVNDERDVEKERARLCGLIERFVAGGPTVCSKHPHMFFGTMTPHEWAILMYKHLDHHLRQFGA